MDQGNSFRSYSRVSEQQEQERQRKMKTRKRLTIIVISTVVLIAITIGALVSVLAPMNHSKSNDKNTSSQISSAQAIEAMCNVTRYPDSCSSSMSSALKASNVSNPDVKTLFLLSLQVGLNELAKLSSLPQWIMSSHSYKNETSDPLVRSALQVCEALFLDAINQFNESISAIQGDLQGEKNMLLTSKINDVRTWLSTAITDQDTCIDGLQETGKQMSLTDLVRNTVTNSTEFTSNSLAIASNVLTILADLHIPIHRKLLTVDHGNDHQVLDEGFPIWFKSSRDRKLLLEENPSPNVTVAIDGSGDFEKISEAVDSIPKRSKSRFVIYVKEGIYVENVNVENQHWNVMMYGDGMNKTIVSGSLNAVDGVATFDSGTFIVEGRGFIGKDMGFKNTAGPEKEQAVAVRSSADKSVFIGCSFDAYQDTLYVHANRQFYRDCRITGTVDFIFGNAAVVFQNCTLQPRQPMENQQNMITAQSKSDPNQNTGISIHECQIIPFEDNLTAPTFLGRPWKDYATAVIMKSFIGGSVDPAGWTPWSPSSDPPKTTFYAEFQNFGPGSATDKRVDWAGVKPNITFDEAMKFTVEPFIQGSEWLKQADVSYADAV